MGITSEHKLAILDLAARYDRAIDERQTEAWLATWAPDGVLEGPFGSYGGDELRRFAAGFLDAGRRRRHLTTRHAILEEGDHARLRSEFLVAEGLDAPKVVATGTYEDELRLVGGEWRFARRRLHVDPGWFLRAQPAAAEVVAAVPG